MRTPCALPCSADALSLARGGVLVSHVCFPPLLCSYGPKEKALQGLEHGSWKEDEVVFWLAVSG
eukprot:2491622-Heterocapsa_arctica.AAC.1